MAKTKSGCFGCLGEIAFVGLIAVGGYIAEETGIAKRLADYVDSTAIPYLKKEVIPRAQWAFDRMIDSGTSNDAGTNNTNNSRNNDLSQRTIGNHTDEIKIEPWNYHGTEWPKEWPTTKSDGSFDPDYIRWIQRK